MRQTLRRVSQNLYKSQESGRYYAVIKVRAHQVKQSLKTDDYAIAKRKLRDLEKSFQDGGIDQANQKPPRSFAELAARFEINCLPGRNLRPTALADYKWRIKALLQHSRFAKDPLRSISRDKVEMWHSRRTTMLHPQRMNNEIAALRDILGYARDNGWMMHDPAAKLKRHRIPRPNPDPPTADEFRRLAVTLRSHRDRDAGDLVELMAYSGLRLSEACTLKWQDVDFDKGMFYIAGKGHDETERDAVPLFPAMRELLLKIRQARQTGKIEGIKPDDRIMRVNGCKDSLKAACREAKLRRNFTHHDMRRYFTTRCMEQGVPIRTLAGWLRHKDGGALLLRTYAAHQDKHSLEMANKINLAVKVEADNVVPIRAAKASA
jgi:integrase